MSTGTLGFALGIQPVLEELQALHALTWQVWYLDDGILFGDASQVEMTFKLLTERFAARGLLVNANKCEIWGPGVSQWQGPPVRVVPWAPQHGVTVLGIPVHYPGSTAYAETFWEETTAKLEKAIELVTQLTDTQCAHHLLRKCLDGCKVTHLLRATDTYAYHVSVQRCEDAILGGFEDLLRCGLAPYQRVQAGLPMRVGGCGLRCPTATRPAARIAALARFYSGGATAVGVPEEARTPHGHWLNPVLMELHTSLGINFDPVTAWLGKHDLIIGAHADHLQQKWWSEALGKQAMTRLLDSVSPRDQARLLEQATSIGSSFMSVPPSTALQSIIPQTLIVWH